MKELVLQGLAEGFRAHLEREVAERRLHSPATARSYARAVGRFVAYVEAGPGGGSDLDAAALHRWADAYLADIAAGSAQAPAGDRTPAPKAVPAG